MDNQYFEGILQLRTPTKEVVKFVKKSIEDKEGVWIAKSSKNKHGYDFYISSWRYLLELGRKLQKKFKGELKTSRKLFSQDRQTGKKKYRVTVMFRISDFKVGDVVWVGRNQVVIKRMDNRVSGKNIKTGKTLTFDYDKMKK